MTLTRHKDDGQKITKTLLKRWPNDNQMMAVGLFAIVDFYHVAHLRPD